MQWPAGFDSSENPLASLLPLSTKSLPRSPFSTSQGEKVADPGAPGDEGVRCSGTFRISYSMPLADGHFDRSSRQQQAESLLHFLPQS